MVQRKRFHGKQSSGGTICTFKRGLDALYPQIRLDSGQTRKLSENAKVRIQELITEFPKITGVMIYEKMIAEGIITTSDVSVDTIQRYIKRKNLRNGQTPLVKERRAWDLSMVMKQILATRFTFSMKMMSTEKLI